jgi:hypothetical protein
MARSIIAVIVGYVAMFVLAFISFTCAYLIVGPGIAFRPATYEAAHTWVAIAFIINIIVAIIGGFICALIAKSGRAAFGLAILAFTLGLLVAIADANKRNANAGLVRSDNTPQLEAVKKAYWPVWVPFAFPLTSAVGILIGARAKQRS